MGRPKGSRNAAPQLAPLPFVPPPPIPMPSAPARGPIRNEMRAPMRGGVLGRNGEVLTRTNRSNEQADQFEIPARFQEKGWSRQWIRTSCLGKPDPANIGANMENGWRPVQANQMEGYFHPVGYVGSIERDGLMLVERPQTLTDQAISDGIAVAKRQKHNQAADFKDVDKMIEREGAAGIFEGADDENDSRGVARARLKTTVEAVPASLYPKRELAIGDDD